MQRLSGGDVTPVWRAGDTVRRATGPWTPAVHALLRHLETVGFDGAPRVLGFDEEGREVLTFLAGDTPDAPLPEYATSDDTLISLAHLLRRYHEAAAGFVPSRDAAWRRMVGAPESGPIICHTDLTPQNVVFRERRPVAFIDWDFAAPAPRTCDVASALKFWGPLMDPARAAAMGWNGEPRGRRVRLFCDEYGLEARERATILEEVIRKQEVGLTTHRVWGESGVEGFARMWREGSGALIQGDIDWLRSVRPSLRQALA